MTTEFLSRNIVEQKDGDGVKRISFNNCWLLILEVVRQVNAQRYALHVGRVIFQKICYVLTRSGVNTGFTFRKSSYGPYSPEVKESITILSNANLMVETQSPGQAMVETMVTSSFVFDPSMFSDSELKCLEKTVDLFCRIKNTDQAEMMATVMYSYDQLAKSKTSITEDALLHEVLSWKKHWVGVKENEIRNTIRHLTMLRWISAQIDFDQDEDF